MKIIDGKLILETRPCHHCGDTDHPGKMPGRKVCTACKGTRRGKRGGYNGCRQCLDGTVYDTHNLVTCGVCDGLTTVPESRYDSVPQELWRGLDFKVIREERGRFGFNESYLGLGYVSTCVDYGDAWKRNDPQALIASVRDERSYTQACSFVAEDLTVAEYIAILVTPNGYKVKAVFKGETPADNSQADAQVKAMFDPRKLAVAQAMHGG